MEEEASSRTVLIISDPVLSLIDVDFSLCSNLILFVLQFDNPWVTRLRSSKSSLMTQTGRTEWRKNP